MPDTRIALDVMGGDLAPRALLEGARLVTAAGVEGSLPPERLLLVGNETVLRREIAALGAFPDVEILHAPQTVEMHESPAQALRGKPDSSIAKCVGAVRSGNAGALVSMGNTGAAVGASTIGLGTLEGVRRPGIAVTLELMGHPVTLLDMGANIVPKPEHLVQYGVMGSVFMHDVLGVDKPRVGLINIGEESSKGTELLKTAHDLLSRSGLTFVGNVEGSDVFQDRAEVIVADGFTGNVVLKLLEGFAGFMLNLVLGELQKHGVKWAPEALANVRRTIDYSEYGGALLLGVSGIVVIGHGRSDANAVKNALRMAARAVDARVNAHIVQGLSRATGERQAAGGG